MFKKKLTCTVFAAVLAAVSVSPVLADTPEEITWARAEKEAAESELNEVQDSIQELESKKLSLEAYLSDLNERLNSLSGDYDSEDEEYSGEYDHDDEESSGDYDYDYDDEDSSEDSDDDDESSGDLEDSENSEDYEDEDSGDDEDEDDEDSDDEDEESGAVRGAYLGNFKLTAYCNCAQCCGIAGQPTASGTMPVEGRTVAMGDVEFGTKLMINGEVYTVEDRGTGYGHVDIYMESHSDCLDFGVQYADVYLVE